jgi:cell division protein FtsI/penicillin-binding protein 2
MAHARAAYHDINGNSMRANAGAVVVLDANTGGVVAMASNPGFDPSWYVHGLTPEQNKYLFKNDNAPSVNRAMQLSYTPGSTFKSITALAAVKEGFASLSGSYPCVGQYTHPNDTSGTVFNNWTSVNLGYMSIARALEVSCDTVFDAFGSDFISSGRRIRSATTATSSSATCTSGGSSRPPASICRRRPRAWSRTPDGRRHVPTSSTTARGSQAVTS